MAIRSGRGGRVASARPAASKSGERAAVKDTSEAAVVAPPGGKRDLGKERLQDQAVKKGGSG